MSGRETDREEGVDFTDIDPILSGLAYPTTKDEFVSEYGDQSIARTNAGPISVREVFDGTGDDTFESSSEVRQSILNLMPRETVGRQRYSDRAGSIPEEGPETNAGGNNESL